MSTPGIIPNVARVILWHLPLTAEKRIACAPDKCISQIWMLIRVVPGPDGEEAGLEGLDFTETGFEHTAVLDWLWRLKKAPATYAPLQPGQPCPMGPTVLTCNSSNILGAWLARGLRGPDHDARLQLMNGVEYVDMVKWAWPTTIFSLQDRESLGVLDLAVQSGVVDPAHLKSSELLIQLTSQWLKYSMNSTPRL